MTAWRNTCNFLGKILEGVCTCLFLPRAKRAHLAQGYPAGMVSKMGLELIVSWFLVQCLYYYIRLALVIFLEAINFNKVAENTQVLGGGKQQQLPNKAPSLHGRKVISPFLEGCHSSDLKAVGSPILKELLSYNL